MKIIKVWLFSWLIFSCLSAKTQTFTTNEVLQDLDFLKSHIERLHPNPFKYITREKFYQVFDSLQTTTQQNKTYTEAYLHFLGFIKQIRCGHTTLFLDDRLLPPSTPDEAVRQPHFLPFEVVILENRIFVTRNFSESKSLVFGTEIVKIEEFSAKQLIETLQKYNFRYADGYNSEADLLYLQRNFSKLFYLFQPTLKTVNLKVVSSENREEKSLKLALPKLYNLYETIAEKYPISNQPKKNLTFDTIKNLSATALLSINSFEENENALNESFRAEIAAIFKRIEEEKIKNLLIDLRGNGGGNLELMQELLKYLIKQPVLKGKVSMKQSTYDFLQKSNSKLLPRINRLFEWQTDRFYEQKMNGLLTPVSANAFQGKIFVLINGNTFSAAAFLASKLQTHANAVLVGTPAGSSRESTSAGFFTKLTLPHTKLVVSLPLCEVDFGISETSTNPHAPLVSDYYVKPSVSDFLQKRDSVKEFVAKLVR